MGEFIQPGQIVSFDTETSGLHPDPPEEARVAVISYAWRDSQGELKSKAHFLPQTKKETWDKVLAGLSRCQLVGHNVKFDLHMCNAGTLQGWPGIDLSWPVFWDTMVAEMILEPLISVTRKGKERPLGLKTIAQRLKLMQGEEVDFADRVSGWLKAHKGMGYHQIPWEILGPYATKDAELTLLLYEHQARRIEAEFQWAGPLVEREMQLLQVLFNMERRGIGFAKEECIAAGVPLAEEIERIRGELPFIPTLPKAKAYFFGNGPGALGLVPYKTTEKTGSAGLDEEVLLRLSSSGAPFGKEYQRYRQLESSLTKYYASWPEMVGRDNRLRTVHSQTNVRSGRLSVSRVQLQAIPHDSQIPKGVPTIRSLFRPRPGAKLYDLDLKNAEVRVAAAITDCKNMKEIILSGRDVHDETCKRIFGKTEDDPEWKRYRDIAKRLTFGTIYGGGANALRQAVALYTGVNLGPGEAEGLIADYRTLYPEFYKTARKAEGLAAARGWVRLISGRQRWFARDEGFHKAFNAVIQGGVAEAMKDWMINIERGLWGILLLQIHDSLVLEVDENDPYDLPHAVAKEGEQVFERAFNFPFVVEVKEWGAK